MAVVVCVYEIDRAPIFDNIDLFGTDKFYKWKTIGWMKLMNAKPKLELLFE